MADEVAELSASRRKHDLDHLEEIVEHHVETVRHKLSDGWSTQTYPSRLQ